MLSDSWIAIAQVYKSDNTQICLLLFFITRDRASTWNRLSVYKVCSQLVWSYSLDKVKQYWQHTKVMHPWLGNVEI